MAKMNQAMSDLYKYNAAILPRKRSSFNKSHSHTTTFDSGYIIPLMWDRVLPGDEKKIKYSGLARMATPIHPVMDEANLDVWCFYVPDRLWWSHAKEFYGENKDAEFNPDGQYQMPSLTPNQYAVKHGFVNEGTGSLNDYFGFPVMDPRDVEAASLLPELRCTAGLHRCYQIIWNEYFRNSSIQPSLLLNTGDTVNSNEWNRIKVIRKANKYPDYFTSLLREPQSGADVSLPLGDWAPVVTRPVSHYLTGAPLTLEDDLSEFEDGTAHNLYSHFIGGVGTLSASLDNFTYRQEDANLAPSNLWTDLTNVTSATINNLRNAITVQHLLEVSNLAGKRYQQILQAHFGVFTPDATLQRPELLGATRTPIGMRQVIQTSETSDGSPLGNTAAYSLTNVQNEWICNKSFTEPGFIMVLGCVRPVISYSQGIDPLLTKINPFDHYWPVFDNLGNQPVYKYNVYAGHSADYTFDGEEKPWLDVLGYQEAWTEYRVKNNRVSGLMRPDIIGNLSSWNYSTFFEEIPQLDDQFIAVDPSQIDRVIATPDQPQFICDSYFDYIDIKNMSVHSIPGLTRL